MISNPLGLLDAEFAEDFLSDPGRITLQGAGELVAPLPPPLLLLRIGPVP
jgi:hypothetical protein